MTGTRNISRRDDFKRRLADQELATRKRLALLKRTVPIVQIPTTDQRAGEQVSQDEPPSELREASDPPPGGGAAGSEATPSCDDRRVIADLPARGLRLDSIFTPNSEGSSAGLPHIIRVLAAMAAVSPVGEPPICVILPSVEDVPRLVGVLAAIEWLNLDQLCGIPDPVRHLGEVGSLIRLKSDHCVFQFGGHDDKMGSASFRIESISRSKSGSGSRILPSELAAAFERTKVKRPLGDLRALDRKILAEMARQAGGVDLLAGVRPGGSTDTRNRVILIDSKTSVEKFLGPMILAARGMDGVVEGDLKRNFSRGSLDDSGIAFIEHPSGSVGEPLIAVSREIRAITAAAMSVSQPGARVVVTDRLRLILDNIDAMSRLAERQRLMLLVDGSSRSDVAELGGRGWTVWEPSPQDIRPETDGRPGLPGYDRLRRGAASEMARKVGWFDVRSNELSDAAVHFKALMRIFEAELSEAEDEVLAVAEDIQHAFFQSLRFLEIPAATERSAFLDDVRRILTFESRLRRAVGDAAGDAIRDFSNALIHFIELGGESGTCLPKGAELLKMARSASNSKDFDCALVTGTSDARRLADEFLARHGVDMKCLRSREIADMEARRATVVFSVMSREAFGDLVDPWPCPHVIFLGYDFENGIYRSRLDRRDRARDRHRLDADRLAVLTCLDRSIFGSGGEAASAPRCHTDVRSPDDEETERAWTWSRKVGPPRPSLGEKTEPATVISFVGRSWMAAADEHRMLMLAGAGQQTGAMRTRNVTASELQVGNRLLIREPGARDIITMIAERRCGPDRYRNLRASASLWKRAIEGSGIDVAEATRRLRDAGLTRHSATIRSWICENNRIGPRDRDDLAAIAEAFPVRGCVDADWNECWDCMHEIRGLHVAAGARLTDLLGRRCGDVLTEPSDGEIMLETGMGSVWLVEVREIGGRVDAPLSWINRIQWTSHDWMKRMQAKRIAMDDL